MRRRLEVGLADGMNLFVMPVADVLYQRIRRKLEVEEVCSSSLKEVGLGLKSDV